MPTYVKDPVELTVSADEARELLETGEAEVIDDTDHVIGILTLDGEPRAADEEPEEPEEETVEDDEPEEDDTEEEVDEEGSEMEDGEEEADEEEQADEEESEETDEE